MSRSSRLMPMLTVLVLALACQQTSSPPSQSGPITLLFPSHLWAQNDWLKRLADDYHSTNPNVSIKAVPVPFGTYHDKTYTQMVAGTPPDIVVPYDEQIIQWSDLGLLEPLNPWLDQAGWTIDKIQKELLPTEQLAIRNGKIYGVVQQSNPRILVYNKALLGSVGLPVPTNPDELLNAMKAETNPSKGQFGFGTSVGVDSATVTWNAIAPVITGYGGALFTNGKPSANDPKTVAALDFLKRAYEEKVVPVGADIDTQDALLVQGKVGFRTIGPFVFGNVAQQNPALLPSISARALPFPGNRTVSVNVFFSVPKNSRNKDAAAKFIVSMLQDRWQVALTTTYVALCAHVSVCLTQGFLSQRPWFNVVLDAGKTAVPSVPQAPSTVIDKVLVDFNLRYQEMLLKGKSPTETANSMQKDFVDLVAPLGG